MIETEFRQQFADAIEKWGLLDLNINNRGTVECVIFGRDNCKHREDGPAVIRWSRTGRLLVESYYQKNQLHRLDGPAVVEYTSQGSSCLTDYYVKGKHIHYDMVSGACDASGIILGLLGHIEKTEKERDELLSFKVQVRSLLSSI